MADLKDTIEKLKLVERELDAYEWYRAVGLGGAVRDAIERLEPKTMTLEEAFEVIKECRHRGDKRWQIEGNMVYLEAQNHALCGSEAVWIARGLLAEKEAARG